jgi:hypothetical protein
MTMNPTTKVREIAGVTTAVANGDLSKKIAVEVKGEILDLKNMTKCIVDRLGTFASEAKRLVRWGWTELFVARRILTMWRGSGRISQRMPTQWPPI